MADFPFPLYPSYTYPSYPPISPFYPINNPLTSQSPNLCFTHGYTPPSFTPSSSTTTLPNHQPTYTSHTIITTSPSPYYSTVTTIPTTPHHNPHPSFAPVSSHLYGHEYAAYCYQQPPHSYSQPTATISNGEINQKALNEILEFMKKFQNEMNESHLAIKKSFQEISESLKSRGKKLPEKMAKAAEEPRVEEAQVKVKQPPQQLSRPPVSTPSPEFEKGNNGYDYFPAPSSPVLPPSQAQGTLRKSHETILAKPPAPKPPPQPPALKSSPETVSATSLAPRPLFNLSDDNFAPTPPPETVSSILPASPPPPKPPDLLLLPDTVLVPPPLMPPPQSPQKPPPPPKPPYQNLTDRALPPRHSIFIDLHSSEFYHHITNSHLQDFPPLDLSFVILGQSHPSKETTIRVLCKLPIMDRHVVFLLLTLGTISTCLLYALAAKCSSQAVFHECYKISDPYTVMDEPYDLGLREMGHLCLLWSNFYGQKSYMSQISSQHNLIDPPHTRLARKPPYLLLNLEDKVQVNLAAMIEY